MFSKNILIHMKTRVFSHFIQPLCCLFCFKKHQGISNSCFHSFCHFVKASLCSLTGRHTQTAARVARPSGSSWAGAAGSSTRDGAWCPSCSSEPGSLGRGTRLEKERGKPCRQHFSFLIKKKKNLVPEFFCFVFLKKHLGIIFPQWKLHKNTNLQVRCHGPRPQLYQP